MDGPQSANDIALIKRVHAFAEYLARGVLQNKFSAEVRLMEARLQQILKDEWDQGYPNLDLLISFGYAELITTPNPAYPFYRLTQKAFQLLERPAESPTVFIAYGTAESSAFGLAIEYRLTALEIPAFIDRSIPIADIWDNHLIERIRQCKYMVCLLAPQSLKRSNYLCKEIELAMETNCQFISIQHSKFDRASHFYKRGEKIKRFVNDRQAIVVADENAKAYHDAVEELVNKLGYGLPHSNA